MTISAAHTYPAHGINTAVFRDAEAQTPDKRADKELWLPVPLDTYTGSSHGYKYYVAESNKETLYTREKRTESIPIPSGSIISIYA